RPDGEAALPGAGAPEAPFFTLRDSLATTTSLSASPRVDARPAPEAVPERCNYSIGAGVVVSATLSGGTSGIDSRRKWLNRLCVSERDGTASSAPHRPKK